MKILEALATFKESPTGYSATCAQASIKPIVHPFWQDLPYSDIYIGITPDILHQLYQGSQFEWQVVYHHHRDLCEVLAHCAINPFDINHFFLQLDGG